MQFFVILLLSLLHLVVSERLEMHSFEPPFTEVDTTGQKIVSRHWRSSGTTSVNTNFVRLTPDRQSKNGGIWSRKALGVPGMNAILKFRISGQGKTFFGDGIGMWIMQQSYHVEGKLHGIDEKFRGVGIIFDTFKNTEHISSHRDVTILVNDGEKTYEMMTEDVQGCNTNVRYHAERADFSVLDSSRAKILLNDTSLSVLIDAKSNGNWVSCVEIRDLKLEAGWLQKSHIGFTGTTGQLADNHDIISFQAFSDFHVMEAEEISAMSRKYFDVQEDIDVTSKISKLGEAVNNALERLSYLDHQFEHEFISIEDHIQNLANKIERKDNAVEPDKENLEQILKSLLVEELARQRKTIEERLEDVVSEKSQKIEVFLNSKISTFESKLNGIKNVDGGWKVPFFVLVFLQILGCIGLYMFYKNLTKRHIL